MTYTTTTPDTITDLAERLTQAIEATRSLADSDAATATNVVRLTGKVDGLKVALSYVQEIQRANPACPSRTGGALEKVPCLLGEGHDGWHKGLGAVWSG